MKHKAKAVDVMCVGHASYDLIFTVPHHPGADEKMVADSLISCGGGPAANAAVQVAKLGLTAAFAGYLGNDLYGEQHYQELINYGVNVDLVVRGESPTPLSTVLVKHGGKRALINFKGETKALPANAIDFAGINPKVILFDGHEPHISVPLAKTAKAQGIPTVLDAGSVHEGTLVLMALVEHLACSEKFAVQLHGDIDTAINNLSEVAPNVVITVGEKGLLWRRREDYGALPAFSVNAVDTTGAGDAFHGAYAAALAQKMEWLGLLRYASAAGSLCCAKAGARLGLASYEAVLALLVKGKLME
ncbi:ribokinase [biofilm metagenome]